MKDHLSGNSSFSKKLKILEGIDTAEEMRIISYSEESSSELNN